MNLPCTILIKFVTVCNKVGAPTKFCMLILVWCTSDFYLYIHSDNSLWQCNVLKLVQIVDHAL